MARQDAPRSIFSFGRARNDDDSTAPVGPQPLLVQLPRLWKAMILTSFLLNLVLFAVVIFLGSFALFYRAQLFDTTLGVQGFARTNVVELRDVVQKLQESTIITTIPLDQPLPLKGTGVIVPVDQQTTVTLVEPVPLVLEGADIDLGGGNRLRASNIRLTLPQGTPLNIALKMDIPLDGVTIPIKLNVPVRIPLKETELGPQFQRLGTIVDRLAAPAAPFLGIEIPSAIPFEQK
ncbi:MAG TPA: hypothetical protein VFS21_16790 [Roseiflexaceae bacterium]|nr:hypothetical protein [Roseiflexaceae bacterium]